MTDSKKKFIYVEDDEKFFFVIYRICQSMGVDVHWLPNVPALNIVPDCLLIDMDFALVDCRGTTLNEDNFLDRDYDKKGIRTIAVSGGDLEFNNIEFIRKDKLTKFLEEYYG